LSGAASLYPTYEQAPRYSISGIQGHELPQCTLRAAAR
jgi:hypothetical protein